MSRWIRPIAIALSVLAFLDPTPMEAQIGGLVDRAKRAAADQLGDEVERLIREAVHCAFDDLECIERAERDGEEVVLTDADGEVLMDEEGRPIQSREQLPPEMASGPAATATGNFDFEAGDRSLFAEDFASDNPGDFPRELEYVRGTMDVVEMDDGRRFLRATASLSRFAVVLPGTLPDRFTVEFDLHDPATEQGTWVSTVELGSSGTTEAPLFNFGNWRGSGIWNGTREPLSTAEDESMGEGVVTVRIMADALHMKVYVGETRVANVPRVEMAREDKLYFALDGRPDNPIYVGDIRVAAGGRDLYEALSTDGRVEIHDILFDTGSDVIRPESGEVLEQIGTMLQQYPDLDLVVEGHTDDQGDFDANMTLSGDRAASVKAYLVEHFDISQDRLSTMGLGQTRPVDSNDTPEGRQRNRRVELVRR